jgi:hypothetical protein
MSLLALTRLLLERRSPMTPVAESGATMMDFARFHADVSANAFRVRQLGCRRGLLVTNDSYWGAVGLFALMHAGAEVVMPQNAQPGTLAAISDAWDLLVCDRPPDRWGAALVLETGGRGVGDALAALDPSTPLSFFTSGSTGAPKRVSKTLAHLDREAQAVDARSSSSVYRHPPACLRSDVPVMLAACERSALHERLERILGDHARGNGSRRGPDHEPCASDPARRDRTATAGPTSKSASVRWRAVGRAGRRGRSGSLRGPGHRNFRQH